MHHVLTNFIERHLLAAAAFARVVVERELSAVAGASGGEVCVVAGARLSQRFQRNRARKRGDRVAARLAVGDANEHRPELIGAQAEQRAALGHAVGAQRQALAAGAGDEHLRRTAVAIES